MMLCQSSRTRTEKVYKKPVGMIGFCGKIGYDAAGWKWGEIMKFSTAGSGAEGIETEALVERYRYARVTGGYRERKQEFSWRDLK